MLRRSKSRQRPQIRGTVWSRSRRPSDFIGASRMRRNLSLLLSLSMFLTVLPAGLWATQNTSTPPTSAQGPGYATKTSEQLQQLVAPVALYPDPLLAQV